jgi:hypothetical protein
MLYELSNRPGLDFDFIVSNLRRPKKGVCADGRGFSCADATQDVRRKTHS